MFTNNYAYTVLAQALDQLTGQLEKLLSFPVLAQQQYVI